MPRGFIPKSVRVGVSSGPGAPFKLSSSGLLTLQLFRDESFLSILDFARYAAGTKALGSDTTAKVRWRCRLFYYFGDADRERPMRQSFSASFGEKIIYFSTSRRKNASVVICGRAEYSGSMKFCLSMTHSYWSEGSQSIAYSGKS